MGMNIGKVEATPVKAVDTMGQEMDILLPYAANLVWGKSLRESTEWASKYAAYKVTRPGSMTKKPGCGYPNREEVERFIDSIK